MCGHLTYYNHNPSILKIILRFFLDSLVYRSMYEYKSRSAVLVANDMKWVCEHVAVEARAYKTL